MILLGESKELIKENLIAQFSKETEAHFSILITVKGWTARWMKGDCGKISPGTPGEKSPEKQECPLDHQFPLLFVRTLE